MDGTSGLLDLTENEKNNYPRFCVWAEERFRVWVSHFESYLRDAFSLLPYIYRGDGYEDRLR